MKQNEGVVMKGKGPSAPVSGDTDVGDCGKLETQTQGEALMF